MSLQSKILDRIKSNHEDWVFTSKDFEDLGDRFYISQILFGLDRDSHIKEITYDIYYTPRMSRFGEVPASLENIIEALQRLDGIIISRGGHRYQNVLGLSTQLVVRPVFLTSGKSQKIRTEDGRLLLELVRASDEEMPWLDKPGGPVVLALLTRYYNKNLIKNNLNLKDGATLKKYASDEMKADLAKHYDMIPDWMKPIIDVVIE